MFARVEKKSPNPVDKHVGRRVCMRRMMLAMSQGKLGDALGLTFQQAQKYEKGTNRIGASRFNSVSMLQKKIRRYLGVDAQLSGQNPPAINSTRRFDAINWIGYVFCKTQPDTSHVNSKAMLFTLTAVVFLAHLARTVWLVTRPEDEIIKYVPDDAFYYVNLAKHFASTGAWTFDGSTVATGFHLAWAYLLAVIFALWPSITFISLLLLAGVISSLAIAFSAYIVCLIALRRFGPSASIGAALVFLSPPVLGSQIMLMETPLVILANALLWYICFEDQFVPVHRALLGFLIGLFGELARSDFGLASLCILFAVGIGGPRSRKLNAEIVTAASALAGSSVGLLVTLAHTLLISGHIFQSSASVKFYWATLEGFKPPLALAENCFNPFSVLIPRGMGSTLIRTAYFAAAIVVLGTKMLTSTLRQRAIVISIIITICAYTALYSFNGSTQIWYSAAFISASALLAGLILCRVRLVLLLIVVPVFLFLSFRSQTNATFPWQEDMKYAGEKLRQLPPAAIVGSWNAGILSFFSGRSVVNLDGLVNDDAARAVIRGEIASYVKERRLNYIVDYPLVVGWGALSGETGSFGQRRGDSKGALYKCVHSVQIYEKRPDEVKRPLMHLYEIIGGCL